ncbi:hypothetical protein BH24ACT3_BH24ACT3_06450 [soil metagenome]
MARLAFTLVAVVVGVVVLGLVALAGPVGAVAARPAQDPGGPPAEGGEPAQSLTGTLRAGDEPVEGVVITVADAAGAPLGEATTDAEGTWEVPLAQPGSYQVRIDPATLPDGVVLANPDRATLTPNVIAGRRQTVVFALRAEGEPDAGGAPRPPQREGPSFVDEAGERTVNGVKQGLIIAMCAVGLSLIFGTTRLINFAHGELVTLGAVVAWFLTASGPEWPLIASGAVAVGVGGLVGGTLESGLWQPLRSRKVGLFQMLVISIGLSILLRHVLLIWFGERSRPYPAYLIQERLELGPFAATPRDVTVMALAVLTLVGVAVMLERTRMGKAMRAVADNIDLAESSGIDVRRVVLFVWIVGAALAALGGVFFGVVETVNWDLGFNLLLLMFAAIILGGLGTAYGAMVGGLVIGLVTELSTIWLSSELKYVWALLALIVVLLVRPQGILGVKERIG